MGRPRGHAHPAGLVWRLTPRLLRLLILMMLLPVSVFAQERTSVMIEKFAGVGGKGVSEFLDLNHTGKSMISSVPYDSEVRSLSPAASSGELRNRDTSAWQTQTIPHAAAPAPVVHTPPAAVPPPVRQLNAFERQAAETIKITNEFRRRNGLPEFQEDPVCSQAAFDHAQDMARRSYFDHFGPGGSSPTKRYQRRNTTGQRVIRITENIARGNGTTPESALRMWLDSSGHRKHLVGTEMNHIGVGVAGGSCFFGPCTYFVQCFSRWP